MKDPQTEILLLENPSDLLQKQINSVDEEKISKLIYRLELRISPIQTSDKSIDAFAKFGDAFPKFGDAFPKFGDAFQKFGDAFTK